MIWCKKPNNESENFRLDMTYIDAGSEKYFLVSKIAGDIERGTREIEFNIHHPSPIFNGNEGFLNVCLLVR